jgi:hypothetical protein
MRVPQVFISSRERELEPEREFAATVIEAMGMAAIRFEANLVPQSATSREIYLDGVNTSALFVLIIWQQDSDAVINEYKAARRRGKPIMCLKKDVRLDYGESRSPRLQEFIQDVESDGYAAAPFRTLKQLHEQLRQGLVLSLAPHDSRGFHATGKEELFTAGTELIEGARKRVVLVAKTPITLLGTRPYDESQEPARHEQQQLEAFDRLIDEAAKGHKVFRCVATKQNMQKALAEHGVKLRDRAKRRVINCFDKVLLPQSNFELRWMDGQLPSSISYLIADDDFLVWLSDGTPDSVWFNAKKERMAMALDRISLAGSTRLSPEEIHHFFEW